VRLFTTLAVLSLLASAFPVLSAPVRCGSLHLIKQPETRPEAFTSFRETQVVVRADLNERSFFSHLFVHLLPSIAGLFLNGLGGTATSSRAVVTSRAQTIG